MHLPPPQTTRTLGWSSMMSVGCSSRLLAMSDIILLRLSPTPFPSDAFSPLSITLLPRISFIYFVSCTFVFSSFVQSFSRLYLFVLDDFIYSRMGISHCWCLKKNFSVRLRISRYVLFMTIRIIPLHGVNYGMYGTIVWE